MKKCAECKCPQPDGRRFHYKDCSIGLEYNRRYETEPNEFKTRLDGELESLESNARYHLKLAKENDQAAGEWRDAVKLTCLDEVYECRLDCRTAPEEVWQIERKAA